MRAIVCWVFVLFSFAAAAQKKVVPVVLASDMTLQKQAKFKYEMRVNRYRTPTLRPMQSIPTHSDRSTSTYWTSAITTQSYGQGKVGTFYYWDVQGNLREMRGFIDIAGKNKRGLKLVFPWR